jgi:hypothetical protein
MQMFIAEVSDLIDQAAFEKSWQSDSTINPQFDVAFSFTGHRISVTVESKMEDRWQSDAFHRTFSSAVRRVDRNCSVRWL